MIDIKDLQIGDWVKNQECFCKVKSIAPDGIYFEDEFGEGVCSYVRLEPIPLTPEILEKNGFEFGYTASEEEFCSATGCGYPKEKGWCYDEGAGEIKIIFPTQSDGGLIRLDDQSFDRHFEIVYVKTIMVHELQHLLRLCGIEKEITL